MPSASPRPTALEPLRLAARTLFRRPAWTATVVLTLGLALGACLAVLTVADAALLRPLPYGDADRLVMVWETMGDWRDRWVAPGNFADWRRETRSFSAFAAYRAAQVNLSSEGPAERVEAMTVTATFFDVLGAAPALGRAFRAEDEREQGLRTVVVSDGLWRRRLGSDPKAVGRRLTLDGEPHQIVGVMPPGFRFATRPGPEKELWVLGDDTVAIRLPFDMDWSQARDVHLLSVVARLAPGVAVEEADAEMRALAARLADAYPDTNAGLGATVVPLREQLAGGVRPALRLLLAAVAAVLLVACANVANLLLVQGRRRERELAVRAALGAGRRELVAPLLVESALLGLAGALVALLVASWGLEVFLRLAPDLPALAGARLDLRMAGAGLGLGLLAAVVFGPLPALAAARPALAPVLGGLRTTDDLRQRRARSGLVVAQVAVAQTLLIGGGLLVLSLLRLLAVPPGFDPERVLTFELSLPDDPYTDPARRQALFDAVLARTRELPGVSGATAILRLPLRGSALNRGVRFAGRPEPGPDEDSSSDHQIASPDVFTVLGNPVLRGRPLLPTDRRDAPLVAVVNEAFAARFFPGSDPLGARFGFGNDEENPTPVEIVGIARDLRQNGLASPPVPAFFTPYAQDREPWTLMAFAVRTSVPPETLSSAVRQAVATIDPAVPVADLRSMDAIVADSAARDRFLAVLVASFSLLALVLAAVGLSAVIAFATADRTREIGVRMALGADRRRIARAVVGDGLRLALLGVALGLAAALAGGRFLASQLFAVRPHDPGVLLTVTAVLLAASTLAAWLPARRAAALDPASVLRGE